MPTITFAPLGRVPYLGGCVTEPAFFALNYLLTYRGELQVGSQRLKDVGIFDTLKAVLSAPATYGVTQQDALDAREHFLQQAGQTLEAEGGQAEWLLKEFAVPAPAVR